MKENHIYKQLAENKSYLIILSVYTFLFLIFCSKMSPLYPINEWADINVYFNVGKGVFSGMTLYSEIFDHKGPLIFIIYGLSSLLSDSSFIGMFIFQVLAWIVALFAVFFTTKLFLRDSSAFLIALLMPLSFLTYMNTGGSAEEMVLVFAIISLYFFAAYFKQKVGAKHKPYYMFVHGVLTAATFLIKLNLMLFWFFPLLAIFITLLIKKEYKNFLQNCTAYLAGFLLISLPICLYFICNGALGEAYHVYFELNKLYSSTDDYSWLVSNGFNKLYREFRAHLVWFIIISIGIFGYPLKFINGKLAKASITLSGVSVFLIIFFPLTFHFYYPLPLFAFATLGLISIFSILERYVIVNSSKKLAYIMTAGILLIGVNQKDFFGSGAEILLRISPPEGPQFKFKEEILNADSPTLLNLAFAEGNSLFTTTGITPTVKYFFCPNIYYAMFPDVRDSQTRYVKNKETLYIVDCNTGFNYEFFQDFEPLKVNYTKIDSCVLNNESINGSPKTFYLYKRNN